MIIARCAFLMRRYRSEFFFPCAAIHDRQIGYAVSAIKPGAKLLGHAAGPPRRPLIDLTEDEVAMLRSLIERVSP